MRRLALSLGLAAMLGACQSANITPPNLTLPAAYEGPPGAGPLTTQQLDHWWLLFNDPQLNSLEADAFRYSPDVRTAQARLMEAMGAEGSQIAKTFPQGDINGNATRQQQYNIGAASSSLIPVGGTYESDTANFNVSWEIDLFGRLALQRKVAKDQYAEARFNIEGTLASLAANVADDYFQARGLAIQIDNARDTVRIETGLQKVAQRKAELGLGAASDSDRVAADLSQAQATVDDLEGQLHAIQRQLLILVGHGIDPTSSLPIDASIGDPPPTPSAIPGDLLSRRPDVREADAHLRASGGLDKLGHLALFPTFTILPGLGLSRTVEPGVSFIPPATLIPQQQSTSLGFWSIGGGVSIPVLDIPQLLYQAKADDARTQEAAIAYEKSVQTAYGEAENALINLAASEKAVAVLEVGEVRSHRASDAAQKRYGMGLDDITAALSAQQAWRTTRAALAAERVQAMRHAVETYKALGGGWAYTPEKVSLR